MLTDSISVSFIPTKISTISFENPSFDFLVKTLFRFSYRSVLFLALYNLTALALTSFIETNEVSLGITSGLFLM